MLGWLSHLLCYGYLLRYLCAARFAFCKQDVTLVESKARFRKLGGAGL